MPLTQLETGGVARSLAQIADRSADHVDCFFEATAVSRVAGQLDALTSERRLERGLAVRLLRDGRSWLASADEVSPEAFAEALARVARVRPGAVAPPPRSLACGEIEADDEEPLRQFAEDVEEAVQRQHAAFAIQWDISMHRRYSRVLGAMLSPTQQEARFYSCGATMPWGRWGGLLLDLGGSAVESVARSLTSVFRAREEPPGWGNQNIVCGPAATAVLLHEAVAHALETDTLALSGRPESALGVRLGGVDLDVLDDPSGAPEAVAHSVDDEGMPVVRRWLLRGGVIEQPLCDVLRGARSDSLIPGAGRRGSRHLAPVPRSTHLELLPGTASQEGLISDCGEGLFVEEFSRGALDPISGRLRLDFAYGRRIENGTLGAVVGAGAVVGSAADVLDTVVVIGGDARPAGAGWCAKGGHRLPVWATTPSILLRGVEVGR